MKRQINRLAMLLALLTLVLTITATHTDSAQASVATNEQADPAIYAVSLFQYDEATEEGDFRVYLGQIRPLMAQHGGRLLGAPIHVRGNLQNPALPPTTVVLTADVITIAEFPNLDAFQHFATHPDVLTLDAAWSTHLLGETRFLGVIPPEFAIFPVYGTAPLRGSPAFLLLNAIQLEPTGLASFNQYSTQAVPLAMAAGTHFFAPIVPIAMLRGEFDYTFFAITEWTSPGVFQRFHHSAEFLEIVPLRNDVVIRFIEAGGHPIAQAE